MNIVTFNDKIKEMTHLSEGALIRMNQLWPKWETAPLFLYDEPDNEAETTAIVTAARKEGENVLEHTPFPVFRLSITVGEHAKSEYGKYKASAIVANYEDGLAVMGRVDDLLHNALTYSLRNEPWSRSNRLEGLPIWMFMHKVVLADRSLRPDQADFLCDTGAMFGTHGRWHDLDRITELRLHNAMSNYFNGLLKSVAAFIISANAPNNHIAEVKPDQPRRSIEWIRARTHFTLITHGHEANSRDVAYGSRVKSNASEELKRMAHNRRAHQRTLRAPRFKYARGKTIWVKATWVGPKEWRDAGGHQIYKILEPVAQEIVA